LFQTARDITRINYGVLPNGTNIDIVTIRNDNDMSVEVLTYGGIIRSIEVPDAIGCRANVVLGFNRLDEYLNAGFYFGAIIGRFANRIGQGTFTLDEITYQLPRNEGPHCLHGGAQGFDKRVWHAEQFTDTNCQGVRLRYRSADGEEGFPGSLDTTVTYRLFNDTNTLRIDYWAETDKPTIVNLTNHSYFNLGGEGSGSALGHAVQIDADHFLPLKADLLPTGEMCHVQDTPMDFRSPRPIEERLRQGTEQLLLGNGYDHNYVLNHAPSENQVSFAARVLEPVSRRTLEVWTTEPGLDFYSGNFLDGSVAGCGGHIYRQGDGIAFEPEHFADSINQPGFPSTVLRPGQVYRSATEFRFGTA
jgi:aldose 1-epimerase